MPNDPLLETLAAVQELIRSTGGQGVYIGAIALGLTVQPRTTNDIDALVLVAFDDPNEIWQLAGSQGFELFDGDTVEAARVTRFLRLVYKPTNVRVDIQVGLLEYDYTVVRRGVHKTIHGVEVLAATPEDLVVMKTVAGRLQDLADIDTIFRILDSLDTSYIRDRLIEFRDFVESPEVIDQVLDKYLS